MLGAIIRWLILVPLSFVMDVLGLVVVPIALLFCNRESNYLPNWAWPWSNDQETINGDPYWQEKHGEAARGFCCRFVWLALRNPSNNFGYWCGWLQASDATYRYWGDPEVNNETGHAGWLLVAGNNGKQAAFCFYLVYPTLPTRCLRMMLGWKIHDMPKDNTKAQMVLAFNPVMAFHA